MTLPPKNLLQILVIQADRRGDDRVGGGEDGYEMQAVEDHSVADRESLSLVNKGDTGVGGEVAAAAVVEHREPEVVAFDEDADDRRDPADERDKSEKEDTDEIDGLPQRVADGEADAAKHVLSELPVESHFVFLAAQ